MVLLIYILKSFDFPLFNLKKKENENYHLSVGTPYIYMDKICSIIKCPYNSIFIDFGCGDGRILKYLSDRNIMNYFYGYEIDEDLVTKSKSKLSKRIIIKNKNVICDRFILSTYCYQLNSENASKKIKFLHENFAFNLMPNITFLLDINPQKGIKRSLKVKKKETKFENKDLKFHKAVREKFLKLSKRNKNVLTINGEKTISQIHIQIIDLINRNNFFKNKLPYSV